MNEKIAGYNHRLAGASPEDCIAFFASEFPGTLTFATSLGAEDQVLTDMIFRTAPEIPVLTLDTGRLFPETYDLIDITAKKYGKSIRVMSPDRQEVEEMVAAHGINLFYDSVENRRLCCHHRKVVPLKRGLSGMQAWFSGLRRGQSVTRKDLQRVEWDETYGLIKINPLLEWTEQEVWDYLKRNKVPYNPLHDKGFPSIGCQPCTRAILPGEDVRAGRWWWENAENRECGLHAKK